MVVIAILALLIRKGRDHGAVELLDFECWILPSHRCWWAFGSHLSYTQALEILGGSRAGLRRRLLRLSLGGCSSRQL